VPRLIAGYWITVSLLVLAGGLVSWFQLKFQSEEPVSKHLARLRIACAMVAVIFLASTNGIASAWQVMPVFTLYSLLAVTAMATALWEWVFYAVGIINGDGWAGVIKRLFDPKRRKRMMDEPKHDKPAPPQAQEHKPEGVGGKPQPQPSPEGVTDGPGRSGENPPSDPLPEQP
jgi:hypothetical protein